MLHNGWANDASSNIKWRSNRMVVDLKERGKSSLLLAWFLSRRFFWGFHLSLYPLLYIETYWPTLHCQVEVSGGSINSWFSSFFLRGGGGCFLVYLYFKKAKLWLFKLHGMWNRCPSQPALPCNLALKTILIFPFSKLKAEVKGCKHSRRWNLSSYFQPEVIVSWSSASDLCHL